MTIRPGNLHNDGGILWPGTYERAAEMAMRQELPRKAQAFRRLHASPGFLVLPNAWDAGSAIACVQAGFPAVATTSLGVTEALGHSDDDSAPPDEVFAVLARAAAAIDVPLTVDVESGYGLAPQDLAARIISAGAVGLNLEDTDHRAGDLRDPEEQAARIRAVKAAGRSLGVDLFLNARVDVRPAAEGATTSELDAAIDRARRYVAAGADGVYPIYFRSELDLGAIAAAVRAPVNALLRDSGPSLERLHGIGVRRVSTGPALWRAAVGSLQDSLAALQKSAAAIAPRVAGR